MHRQQCRIGSLAVTLILALSVSATAQGVIYEYGSTAELEGVMRVYVYAGSDIDVQQNMVKEIAKKLPQLQIADRPEDAEVILIFSSDSSTFLSNLNTSTYGGTTTTTTPQYSSVQYGSGLLVKRGSAAMRLRVLAEFKDNRHTIFERRMSTNIARDFVKAYQKANGKSK